jgi:hypothetical protein
MRRSTIDVVSSCNEAFPACVPLPVSVPLMSDVGVIVAAGNRLAIPGGGAPPASSVFAMPGGRAGSRFARPGGMICDLPGEVGGIEVTGPVIEMCICTPVRRKLYAADGIQRLKKRRSPRRTRSLLMLWTAPALRHQECPRVVAL